MKGVGILGKSKLDEIKSKFQLIEGWAKDGLSDEQISRNLGISKVTFYKYKASCPELNERLKRSKEVVDYEVENALYKSAINGNVSAMIFWLKNRKPSKWRDRREHSELELMKKELELRERKLKLEEQKLEDLKNKILNIDINIID